jgi:YVTN family beta-propeller protein
MISIFKFHFILSLSAILIAFLAITTTASAITTIPIGDGPFYSIAVGTKVYATNQAGGTVSVINTLTDIVSTTIPIDNTGTSYFVNTIGNKIYIMNQAYGGIAVIDTITDTLLTTILLEAGQQFSAIAGTNLYVLGSTAGNVYVIDTITDTITATIPVGSTPYYPVIVGTKLYVTNTDSSTVSVINTATNTVTATIAVGVGPSFSNALGDKVYIVNGGDDTVSVIDTTTNGTGGTVVATIPVGNNPIYPPVTVGTKVYVWNEDDYSFSVIDSLTNTVTATTIVGTPLLDNDNFYFSSVLGNKIYTVSQTYDQVSVIDTDTDTVLENIAVGQAPIQPTISGTKIYVNNGVDNTLSVFDTTTIPTQLPNLTSFSTSATSGSYDTGDVLTITANFGPALQAGSTMTVLLNSGSSVVLDQISGTTISGTYTVQGSDMSPDLAVESITNTNISDGTNTRTSYTLPSSQGSLVAENSFITRSLGDTKNITINVNPIEVAVGDAPYQISANINGYLYVANQSAGTVSVVRISDNTSVATITVGSEPYGLATVGTQLYIANTGSNTVSVIDTTTNMVTDTVAVGVKPYYVAVVGTDVYVTNGSSNTVSVIDSTTNTVTDTVAVGSYPRGIRAYGTDLYVANYGNENYSGGNYISVIDSTSNTVSDTIILPAGSGGPRGVTSLGTKVYVTNFRSNNVSVINTATNTITATIAVGTGPRGIVGLGTNIYVENFDDGTISIIDTNTNTVTDTIDVGHSPSGMSIVGTDIYVSAFQDDMLRILDTTTGELEEVTVPSVPTSVSAIAGNNQAVISFTEPTSNGGSDITLYTVTSSPESITATGTSSPITVSGLESGTEYTFTVIATNIAGNSSASDPSNTVTPIQRTTSGSYSTGTNNPPMVPILPIPTDCLPGYNFSPSTGSSCSLLESQTKSVPSTPPSTFNYTRTLKLKMTGPDVKALQKTLNAVLKLPKPLITDGIFGNNTLIALKMFQKEKGLVQDGIFGEKSRGGLIKI